MDLSFLTGLVSENHLKNARPEFVERLQREGKLDQMLVMTPPSNYLRAVKILGLLATCAGWRWSRPSYSPALVRELIVRAT